MRQGIRAPSVPRTATDAGEREGVAPALGFRDALPSIERLRTLVETHEHRQRLTVEANRKSERIRESIRRKADMMEIPRDEDLRAVIEHPDAPRTAAMCAVREALEWRGKRHRGMLVVLGGPTGVGKTAAACHALARYERGGLYTCAQVICANPRTGYSSVEDLWSKLANVAMLVIDDAGTESHRPELIRNLLLSRFDAGLVTIVSSNLSRAEFAERYLTDDHGRLADRLINAQGRGVDDAVGDDGQPWYIDIAGASLRSVEARARLCSGAR
ncbi:MAG: hypothetical protein U0271_47995 [Polyangiaceae bacterium]